MDHSTGDGVRCCLPGTAKTATMMPTTTQLSVTPGTMYETTPTRIGLDLVLGESTTDGSDCILSDGEKIDQIIRRGRGNEGSGDFLPRLVGNVTKLGYSRIRYLVGRCARLRCMHGV